MRNEVGVIIWESSGGPQRAWGLQCGQYHYLQEENSQAHLARIEFGNCLELGRTPSRASAGGARADQGAEPGRRRF